MLRLRGNSGQVSLTLIASLARPKWLIGYFGGGVILKGHLTCWNIWRNKGSPCSLRPDLCYRVDRNRREGGRRIRTINYRLRQCDIWLKMEVKEKLSSCTNHCHLYILKDTGNDNRSNRLYTNKRTDYDHAPGQHYIHAIQWTETTHKIVTVHT